jgi:hypothetical protein
MGLDTTHNCWHGPYSSFNNWRREVCKVANVSFDREGYTSDKLLGTWKEEPTDILDVLIEHQDCEGIIEHRHCLPLAERLFGLLPLMPDNESHFSPRKKTLQFIQGLRDADAAGENVEFH